MKKCNAGNEKDNSNAALHELPASGDRRAFTDIDKTTPTYKQNK